MTNITLSIEDSIYNEMKKYSEIKWSDFVRKCIEKRILDLKKIDESCDNEGIFCMLTSEEVLRKDWDNDFDKRWNNV